RVVGYGPAVVHIDDLVLTREQGPGTFRLREPPVSLEVSSGTLRISFHSRDGRLSVLDRRTGRTWSQKPAGPPVLVKEAREVSRGIEAVMIDPRTVSEFSVRLELEADRPELLVELSGTGELGHPLSFPYPFLTEKGTFLVMPVNEGMSYPVDDPSLQPMQYILYGGHGLCMAWWGVSDGHKGMMAIVETPDDASISVPRIDGKLCQAPLWDSQKGIFGPARRIRYVFLDDGGYIAM